MTVHNERKLNGHGCRLLSGRWEFGRGSRTGCHSRLELQETDRRGARWRGFPLSLHECDLTSTPDPDAAVVDGAHVGTTDAALRIGVSASYVRQLIAAGELPAQRVGRAWRVLEADLEALAQQRARRARPVAQPAARAAQPSVADTPLSAEDAFAIERALLQSENDQLQRRLAEAQQQGLQRQVDRLQGQVEDLRSQLDARDDVIRTLLAARTTTTS